MIQQVNSYGSSGITPRDRFLKTQAEISFAQILSEKTQHGKGLKFSGHAMERLRERGINLSSEQLKKLDETVEKASQKGARSSLVLMHNLALIVSVKNRTVITAIDEPHIKENIFTNIDSAAII